MAQVSQQKSGHKTFNKPSMAHHMLHYWSPISKCYHWLTLLFNGCRHQFMVHCCILCVMGLVADPDRGLNPCSVLRWCSMKSSVTKSWNSGRNVNSIWYTASGCFLHRWNSVLLSTWRGILPVICFIGCERHSQHGNGRLYIYGCIVPLACFMVSCKCFIYDSDIIWICIMDECSGPLWFMVSHIHILWNGLCDLTFGL